MFEKRISADAWKEDLWGEETPRAAIIRASSRGITGMDKVAFEKRAMAASAELLDKVDKLPTNPGEVLVHLIALGSTEAYGPNRNGDGFSKAACIKYHPSFVSDARVYRNHKNKDTSKSYGVVKASAYNDQMSRVELIVGLNGTKEAAAKNGGEVADKELEKLESGDFPVSMSCFLDGDFPILTSTGYIPIQDIKVGTEVWTHNGNWKRVTEIMQRSYTGTYYSITANGLPIPLDLTAEHPLLVMKEGSDEQEWVRAEDLAPSYRLLCVPVSNYPPEVVKAGGALPEHPRYMYKGMLEWNTARKHTFLKDFIALHSIGNQYTDAVDVYWDVTGLYNALYWRDFLAATGIPCYIGSDSWHPSATSDFSIYISKESYQAILNRKDIPAKVSEGHTRGIRRESGGILSYGISCIKRREAENTTVYNFEVEDDHSYSAAGLISHNCRVPFDVCSYCGNKATSPDKYCKGTDEGGHCKAGGLQHRMGKLVTVEGKLHTLFADNTEPHFFDISHVIVPADRIAYTSGKLTKSAEYLEDDYFKVASILPESNGQRICQPLVDSVVHYHQNQRWEKMAMVLPFVTAKPLKRLPFIGQYKFASVARAMSKAGICLTAPQFLQLTTGTDIKTAQQLGEIIAPLSNEQYTKMAYENPYIPANNTCEKVREWVASQELPTIFGNDWHKQASLAITSVLPPPQFSLNYIYGLADDPQIQKLANHFAMYKSAFVESLPTNKQRIAATILVERDYARL